MVMTTDSPTVPTRKVSSATRSTHGAVSIDEWCLDYITDDGWSVGSIRWG